MPACLQEILDRTIEGVKGRTFAVEADPRAKPGAPAAKEAGDAPLPTLEDLINEYVRYLIRLTSHNIALTAKILNVSRSTLYHRLHRLEPKL